VGCQLHVKEQHLIKTASICKCGKNIFSNFLKFEIVGVQHEVPNLGVFMKHLFWQKEDSIYSFKKWSGLRISSSFMATFNLVYFEF
jgi:hypothetical protein